MKERLGASLVENRTRELSLGTKEILLKLRNFFIDNLRNSSLWEVKSTGPAKTTCCDNVIMLSKYFK